jgi:xanthine/CO dehydrogenase XdhC/CoxF family maturation factor
MTHEFKTIIAALKNAQKLNLKGVMASVVALDGSSYRRPGVRMLILENGSFIGAVSGGCVEKEVFRQAEEVFRTGMPKMMTYDGRYRLGCEGILYILIEPIAPSSEAFAAIERHLKNRSVFELKSYYRKAEGINPEMGTEFIGNDLVVHQLNRTAHHYSGANFTQKMYPCKRLIIFGGEHDAVVLTEIAAQLGWEVEVVVAADEQKSSDHFPKANTLHQIIPESFELENIDSQTAVLLMTHSYSKDLKYLLRLSESKPAYFGILGPAKRRERLLNDLLEYQPEVDEAFLARIHGPAGLDLGSEGPQEIAVSILAEIIAVTKGVIPISLRNKSGAIHDL